MLKSSERDKHRLMQSELMHKGIVDSIDGDTVYVRILKSSACQECQAKSLCKVTESDVRLIEASVSDASNIEVGQQVLVSGTFSQGMNAVLIAFAIPLFLILSVVVIGKIIGISDGYAALSALVVMIPYYFVLFLCRDRLKNNFQFRIVE